MVSARPVSVSDVLRLMGEVGGIAVAVSAGLLSCIEFRCFFFVLEGRTVVVGVLDCQMLKTWTGRAEVRNGAAFKGSSGGNCID